MRNRRVMKRDKHLAKPVGQERVFTAGAAVRKSSRENQNLP